MFRFLRKRQSEKHTAYKLYTKLVDQARLAAFYREYGVEDTIEGRFDMILLHLFLVDDRLSEEGGQLLSLRRTMQEAMVSDLDRSFRELGIGDMSVGKEMKKVGSAWLGRQTAYAAALEEGAEPQALENALINNLYAGQKDVPAKAMAHYVKKAQQLLALTETDSILTGELVFPKPEKNTMNEKVMS